MSGCTGRCNQGRNCTCFQGSSPRPWLALSELLAMVAAVGLVVAYGFFWGFLSVARDCDRDGSFRPLVEAMALVDLICDQVAEGGEPAAKH